VRSRATDNEAIQHLRDQAENGALAMRVAEVLPEVQAADELDIASRRADGSTSRPTTIWVVRVGDELYVRSYRGRTGGWFSRGAALPPGSRPRRRRRPRRAGRRARLLRRVAHPVIKGAVPLVDVVPFECIDQASRPRSAARSAWT
jgi:hypothetical protein